MVSIATSITRSTSKAEGGHSWYDFIYTGSVKYSWLFFTALLFQCLAHSDSLTVTSQTVTSTGWGRIKYTNYCTYSCLTFFPPYYSPTAWDLQEEVIIFLNELFLSSISLFLMTPRTTGASLLSINSSSAASHTWTINLVWIWWGETRAKSPCFVFTVWSSPCSQMWRTERWSGAMGGPRPLRGVIDLLSCPPELWAPALQISVDTQPLAWSSNAVFCH